MQNTVKPLLSSQERSKLQGRHHNKQIIALNKKHCENSPEIASLTVLCLQKGHCHPPPLPPRDIGQYA